MEIETLTTLVGIIAAFDITILALVIFFFHRRKGKWKINIHTPIKQVRYIKPNLNDSTVIVTKENKRKNIPEWKAFFSRKAIQIHRKWFGRIGFEMDIFPNALKFCEWDFDNNKLAEYGLTLQDAMRIINAKIVEQEGKEKKKESSMLLWIILGATIINVLVILYMLSKIVM